jgi:regulator of protease activity HflC (stomatin/prohibitin superfamily)
MNSFQFLGGLLCYIFFRCILTGWYTVRPDQCAVVTSFGRAQRLQKGNVRTDPFFSEEEQRRYQYPQVKVRGPGGPYFRFPWQKVHKVRVATETVDLCWDPTKKQSTIEAVTKDNLTTGVNGQIRYKISKDNLYPYLFSVDSPLEHVMGYFVSVIRERIANFVDPKGSISIPTSGESDSDYFEGVSINDLRKNLPLLNSYMEEQSRSTAVRYGIELDAALVTTIDPPAQVDHALSAINTTRNQVAADISTARADADQQITMSQRAVEIANNNAHAEVSPLKQIARTLSAIKGRGGSEALQAYLRTIKIPLLARTDRLIDSLPKTIR